MKNRLLLHRLFLSFVSIVPPPFILENIISQIAAICKQRAVAVDIFLLTAPQTHQNIRASQLLFSLG